MRKILVVFFVRGGAVGLAFLLNIMVARMAGVNAAGFIFSVFALSNIAAVFFRGGVDGLVIKSVAASSDKKNASKSYFYASAKIIFMISMAAGLGGGLAKKFLGEFLDPNTISLLDIRVLVSGIGIALVLIESAIFKAIGVTGLAAFFETGIIPLLNIVLVAFGVVFFPHLNNEQYFFINLYSASCVFSSIVGFVVLLILARASEDFFYVSVKKLLKESFPLFQAAILDVAMLWLPPIFLTVLSTYRESAIFSAAHRTASLINFLIAAINVVLVGKIASACADKDIEKARGVVREAAKTLTLLGMPLIVLFVFFPDVVSYLYGSEFVESIQSLRIIAFGFFSGLMVGPVGYILIMSGAGFEYRNIIFRSFLLMLGLGSFASYYHGAIGLALVFSAVMCLQNIFMWVSAHKKELRINV